MGILRPCKKAYVVPAWGPPWRASRRPGKPGLCVAPASRRCELVRHGDRGRLARAICGYLCVSLLATPALAEIALSVARVLNHNAVVQHDMPIPVWGQADPGESITVEFAGQSKRAEADANGKWKLQLDPLPASSEARTLKIVGSKPNRQLQFNDILVGEVWVLAGQSNMGWRIMDSTNRDEARQDADQSWLRLLQVERHIADEPMDDIGPKSRWLVCTPETVDHFSAAGYFFARNLHEHVDVPIGLVGTAVPATYGECWLSREKLESDPEFQPRLDEYEEALEVYPEKHKEWMKERAAYKAKAEAAKKEGKSVPPMSFQLKHGPLGPKHFHRPYGLYNGMIAPLMPYAIRGVLWYQGEGNAQLHRVVYYDKLLEALIDCWRTGWEQGDFPFIIVQLPGFDYDVSKYQSWPLLREAQLKAAQQVNNTGLVVTIDLGERDDIHPPDKREVGARIAHCTRAVAYGENIEGTGPLYKSMQVQGESVKLTFSHVGDGLHCEGKTLTGFVMCGPDHEFHPAEAKIAGEDKIVVKCSQVSEPVAVRYAWAPFPDWSLYNSEGLPASPFRTDSFPLEESR